MHGNLFSFFLNLLRVQSNPNHLFCSSGPGQLCAASKNFPIANARPKCLRLLFAALLLVLPFAAVAQTSMGSISLGSSSGQVLVTVPLPTGGTVGSFAALTQGTAGLDFSSNPGGSCSGTFSAGQSCTVYATFTPKYSGTRYGAVVVYDTSSPAKVIGTAYLTGTGVGPQVAFVPGTLSSALTPANAFMWLGGIAVDGSENVYLADGYKAVWLLKAPAPGLSYTASLLGGLNGSSVPNIAYDCPQYTAVDGAGNIYVADYGCNTSTPAVYQLVLQSGGSYTKNVIGSGFVNPMGVAVDSAGNVYVTDIGTGFAYKLTLTNGSYVQTTIASGISSVNDLAVDISGNVYIASDSSTVGGVTTASSIIKLAPSGTSYTKNTLGSGWILPNQIAIDGNGNLYVSDMSGPTNTVVKLTPQTDGSYVQSAAILRTQLAMPVGVAVDGAGNPFVVDSATNNVFKLDIASGPALNFPTATAHGSTDTADGTLKATIQNIGNQPLTFSSIVASTNFQLDSTATTCSTVTSLAVNATCVVGVTFAPTTAGAITGTVTLTDNASNGSQIITLSGSGTVLPPAPVIASEPASHTTALSAAFTFSDTQSGVTFQCSLDSATYAACVSGISYSSLALGAHSFAVEAVDGSNNISAAATYSWTIVAPPPAPSLVTYPASSTTATTASFSFMDSQSSVSYQCSLDSAAYAACGVSGNPTGTATYSSLAIGAHTFGVEAVDAWGNVGAATTYNWTITLAPVSVTISTVPTGLSITVDGTSYTSPKTLSWTQGSTHTIATTQSQTPTGIQATFVSWSDGGALSHSVTATAGVTSYAATFTASYLLTTAANPTGSGTVSPDTGTFYPSGTVVNLTATANTGYAFGVWSGTVASQTSSATTVTMSAPQTAIANFSSTSVALPQWTWEGGSNTGNKAGTYGTLQTAATTNIPGGRSAYVTWTDSSGNLWLFGGKGYDSAGTLGNLNDLWKFTPSTGWTWMAGSKTVNAAGSASGSAITPGARQYALSWTDSSGNFWLFGGSGYDVSSTLGTLHDLWKYNSSSGWSFVGGSSTVGTTTGTGGQLGIYGTLGAYDALNLPGSRQYSVGWADSTGNLWLFGGQGYDSKGTLGYLNDLWEFTPSQGTAGQWRWMGGSNVASKTSVAYGTQGTPSTANIPGGRLSALSLKDKSGNFWLFSGEGYDANGVFGELNDLWEYIPSAGTWTWVSGGNTTVSYSGIAGVYGTLGTPAAGNLPGGRQDATGWVDSGGNFWIFGGIAIDRNGTSGTVGDLWQFNTSTKLWTWMGGSNTNGGKATYGTLLTPAATNMPGARYFSASWIDGSGNPWIFGGYGKDSTGTYTYLNDVWEYGYTAALPPPAPAINSQPENPTTATSATFTFSDTQSGVTFQCSLDNAAYAACSSGISYSSLAAGAHTFAVEAVDSSSNASAAATYSWTISAATVQIAMDTSPTGLSFSVDGTTYTGAQTFNWIAGSAHTIATTTPQTSGGNQYTFASWSDSGLISHSVTAPASAASYTATFNVTAKTTPAVTVAPTPTSITTAQALAVAVTVSGTPTPTGSITLSSGSYASAATQLIGGAVTINVPAGSLATGTDTLTASYTPDSASSSIYNSATGSNSVTVTVATVQVTVGTNPSGLSFSVDGTSYAGTQTLTWNVGSSHTIATVSPQTSAGVQNTFASWSDAGAISHSVTAPSSATSYTATFTTSYQLTTAASPAGAGTVTPATGSYYASGTVVNIAATPNSGYTFTNWTGSVASTSSASTTVTMNAPQSVTANFSAVSTPGDSLTAGPFIFTAVAGTTSAAQVATLSSTGNAPLTISSITITGANPSAFAQTNTCGTTLAVGSSCTISVTFTPSSAGAFSGYVSVVSSAGSQPQTITLSGTGTAAPSFTVSSPTSAQTVHAGGAATYTITITPQNGAFSSPITLSASGLPTGATATFSPASITPGNSPASSTLTIQTAATKSAAASKQFPWPIAAPALAFIGIFFLPGKRRRRCVTLAALLLASLGAFTALTACGGGFGLASTATSYNVTITATSGTAQQTTTVRLTVQ